MKPMLVDQVTHEELENWGRVVRDPKFVPRTCYSAEGRYRPERVKDGRDRELTAMPAPDVHGGLLAERVICHPDFPVLARALLAGHYVHRFAVGQVCRFCGVQRSRFDVMMGWAAKIFCNRLDIAKRNVDRIAINNSTPPTR
jgi:hypothetical protein